MVQTCVGAIDGTYVSAWCKVEHRDHFRSRHGDLSQTVLAVCDHDMWFVYVWVGWEGSAYDSRMLQSILQDLNCAFPMPPEGLSVFSFILIRPFSILRLFRWLWTGQSIPCSLLISSFEIRLPYYY